MSETEGQRIVREARQEFRGHTPISPLLLAAIVEHIDEALASDDRVRSGMAVELLRAKDLLLRAVESGEEAKRVMNLMGEANDAVLAELIPLRSLADDLAGALRFAIATDTKAKYAALAKYDESRKEKM